MKFSAEKPRRLLLREISSRSIPIFIRMYGIWLFPIGSIKTILDIGANIGFFSTAFKFYQPCARIIAVEPDNFSFWCLRRNLHGLNIEIQRMALGDGTEFLEVMGRHSLCNKFVDNGIVEAYKLNDLNKKTACPSLRLSEMINQFKINTNGLFIKIDCEGGEKYLMGHKESEDILSKCVGVSFEMHHRFPGMPNIPKSLEWANNVFGKTHNIHSYCRKALHLTAIDKNIKLNTINEI